MIPIKTGTANRLGLRTPTSRTSLVRFGYPEISEQDTEKFEDCFRAKVRRSVRAMLATGDIDDLRP